MRYGSPALKAALTGPFDKRYVADIWFGGTRVRQDIPIIEPSFNDSASAAIQSTGSCTIVYQGDFADSIAPSKIGDMLAPFGTRIIISALIAVGPGLQERVVLGQYLLIDDPEIRTTRTKFNGAIVAKGDLITLTLQDLFAGVQWDRFDTPGSAPDTSSVWKEYQRLVGLPVTRTVADATIPNSVAYQEDKLQACYDLATVLDAVAYVTPDGTASMRPNVWPAPVDTLSSAAVSDTGTLVDVVPSLSNEAVYNAAVVRGQDPSGKTIVLATQEITDGTLRVRNADGSLSPYRRRPTYAESQYITANQQALSYASQLIQRVSKLRSIKYQLVEMFNPLRELGDVLTVNRLGETFTCRITDIARDAGPTQTLTVAVYQ